MRSELYWIDGPWKGRLAILPRPRGGDWLEDEVREWQIVGVNTMVTLLTNDEVADLDLAEEARLCRASGIDLVSFPIVDRSVPASRRRWWICYRHWKLFWRGARALPYIVDKESAGQC